MMLDKITNEQLENLYDADFYDKNEFHALLKEYAGIEARRYTGYQYYDAAGDYLGDSENTTIMGLLKHANIEVVDGGADNDF